MPDTSFIIQKTADFVKTKLQNAEAGHDWWHVLRVWNNAKLIAKTENVGIYVVELAALLHDIADSKFYNGDEEIGPKTAGDFLKSLEVEEEIIVHVQQIIRHMSFKSSFGKSVFSSAEMNVVQDADRLDAIGAIGVARAFTYGGFKGRELYNPDIAPDFNLTKEAYKNSAAPTVNHFYEKLLKLKELMHTETARKIAGDRHLFMETYLQQFYAEWAGEK